jgi:hypothetical protein
MPVTNPITREQITVSSTAIGCDNGGTLFTTENKGKMRYADMQVQTAQIRVTFDGSTAPVAATTGQLWSPGDLKRVWGLANIEKISFIRESTDATVVVNYWGE